MARVLFVSARLPFPPREGHQLRSWHLLRALCAAHEVTLLSFERSDDHLDECAPLRRIVARLETFPIASQHSRVALIAAAARGVAGRQPFVAHRYRSAALRARVAALARGADLVHVDMLPLMTLADVVPGEVPLILDAHNVEHQLLRQRVRAEPGRARRVFLRGQVARLRRFERDACRRADRVLACSIDDAIELCRLEPQARIDVVPNGVDARGIRPGATQPAAADRLVFVGQMGWFPNREGIEWFLDAVLPRLVAARPDVTFELVGRNDGLQVPQRLRANVRLAGFVDEVAPAIDAASVYVVPLRSGSGTRLKVLEAMAFGKAIVTTTIGSQGIDLVPGREALFADSADGFAAAVLRLLADPHEAQRLGAAARAKALARYDWSAIGRAALPLYDELLARRSSDGMLAGAGCAPTIS